MLRLYRRRDAAGTAGKTPALPMAEKKSIFVKGG